MASRNNMNKKCTIRNLEQDDVRDNVWKPKKEKRFEHTFIVGKNITKYEVARISGITILNFCRGLKIHLILTSKNKDSDWNAMLNLNLIPEENTQHKYDEIHRPRQEDLLLRRKRQVDSYERPPSKKRYRGQTQTQFIAFDKDGGNGTNKGIAEAVAQPDLSRATVSGTNGMGQAQSQSGTGDDCEECFPYGILSGRYPIGPDGRPGVSGIGYPGGAGVPGQVIGAGYPGVPGYIPGAGGVPGAYPGQVIPGGPGAIPGQVISYPGQVPGTTISYPGAPGVIGQPGVGGITAGGPGIGGAPGTGYPGAAGQTPGVGV